MRRTVGRNAVSEAFLRDASADFAGHMFDDAADFSSFVFPGDANFGPAQIAQLRSSDAWQKMNVR